MRYPIFYFCFSICLLALFGSCTSRKPLAKTNLAFRYDVGFPIEEQHVVIDREDDLDVYFQLNFKKLGDLINPRSIWDKYSISYTVSDSYSKKLPRRMDTLGIENRVSPSGNPVTLFLKISKSAARNQLLVISVKDRVTSDVHLFDIPLSYKQNPIGQALALFEVNEKIPVYRAFILNGDSVVLRNFGKRRDTAYCQFHPFNSSVALPPMSVMSTSGHDFDSFDKMAIPLHKLLVFKQSGYYFFPSEKPEQAGYGFMVIDPTYPRVTKPIDLIDPMIYISTREERKNLLEASNRKVALDQFWLKVNNQKDEARKVIKAYFENIEAANQLFSSHKSGWRTDRGMVLSIYGPPEVVYRNWDSEIWQYPKSTRSENPIFYFNRRALSNGVRVWEMKRFEEYDRIWYSRVELWRKGIINP